MSVNVNILPGGNAIHVKFLEPFNIRQDMNTAVEQVLSFSPDFRPLTYIIFDMCEITIQFADVVQGMSGVAQLVSETACSESACQIQPVLVGEGALLNLATESFAQDQYGNLAVPTFTDLAAAINFTRGEIAELFK